MQFILVLRQCVDHTRDYKTFVVIMSLRTFVVRGIMSLGTFVVSVTRHAILF